jgi:hypothetical protein
MKTLQRIRKRQGRCYELVGRVMLYEEGSEAFTLVHGVVNSGFAWRRVEHAWIELPDGRVYEPVLNEYMDKAGFDSRAKPSECQRYTLKQAVRLIGYGGNFGPWTDSERLAYAGAPAKGEGGDARQGL